MTNAEAVNLIVAIGAALATGLSAMAAFRSAKSAEFAQRTLDEGQLRSDRRDVAQLVADCAFEFRRIHFLAHTLRVIDRTNAIFTGGLGGDRHKVAEDSTSARVAKAETFFGGVSTFVSNPAALGSLSREDVDRLRNDLSLRLAELRAIAEELSRDSASREAQLLQLREKAVMGRGA